MCDLWSGIEFAVDCPKLLPRRDPGSLIRRSSKRLMQSGMEKPDIIDTDRSLGLRSKLTIYMEMNRAKLHLGLAHSMILT